MDKSEFVQLIKEYEQYIETIEDLSNALNGLDLYGTGLFDYGLKMFDKVLNLSFSQDVVEVISWWIYEADFGEALDMYIEDTNKQKHYISNIDELWDYINKIE